MEDGHLSNAESVKGKHDGHGRPPATSLRTVLFEVKHQVLIIEFLYILDRDGVKPVCNVARIIVRKVCACHEQGILSLQHAAQSLSQGKAILTFLISHHDGQECEVTEDMLQER